MKWLFLVTLTMLGHSLSFAEGFATSTIGFEIMRSQQLGNCVACHDIPGVQGRVSTLGPSLQGVARKWSRTELTQWVKDARKINPETLMPPFGVTEGLTKAIPPRAILSDAQILQVVDTLQSWQ